MRRHRASDPTCTHALITAPDMAPDKAVTIMAGFLCSWSAALVELGCSTTSDWPRPMPAVRSPPRGGLQLSAASRMCWH
jgi:hypothetical protein